MATDTNNKWEQLAAKLAALWLESTWTATSDPRWGGGPNGLGSPAVNTAGNHDRDWDTLFETGGDQLDVGGAVQVILWGQESGEAAEHQQGAKMCTEPE